VRWEALHAFNPAAVVKDGRIYVLYRGEDDRGTMEIGGHTSRLGLAVSDDGFNFERLPVPVVYPGTDDQEPHEWSGGCEDPRIVESEDDSFVLTYTQWNRRIPRLAIATSRDLITWKKHGAAFRDCIVGGFGQTACKSGSIVCSLQDGRLKAVRVHGKYWMYWGEHTVRLAYSHDLLNWKVVDDGKGRPLVVLDVCPGRFDSELVEAGPPAVLTDAGIVLMYNARSGDDQHVNMWAYSGGQALFDAKDPRRIIGRLDEPFIYPQLPFERTGQYSAGTTFTEGLVYRAGTWFLYYGCADSVVAVATSNWGSIRSDRPHNPVELHLP
jgi:predicted GH43/DUF377 family glycosyl hydrolase